LSNVVRDKKIFSIRRWKRNVTKGKIPVRCCIAIKIKSTSDLSFTRTTAANLRKIINVRGAVCIDALKAHSQEDERLLIIHSSRQLNEGLPFCRRRRLLNYMKIKACREEFDP